MKYQAVEFVFRNRDEAAVSVVAEWICAGGLNTLEEIEQWFAEETDVVLVAEFLEDGWGVGAEDVPGEAWFAEMETADWLAAIAVVRTVYEASEA